MHQRPTIFLFFYSINFLFKSFYILHIKLHSSFPTFSNHLQIFVFFVFKNATATLPAFWRHSLGVATPLWVNCVSARNELREEFATSASRYFGTYNKSTLTDARNALATRREQWVHWPLVTWSPDSANASRW